MERSVRWLLPRVLAAASAAIALVVGTIAPASATAPVTSIRANEWWLAAMHVPDVIWPRSTGAGITVAVIDSGVDANHPDLVGQVLPGQNFSPFPVVLTLTRMGMVPGWRVSSPARERG